MDNNAKRSVVLSSNNQKGKDLVIETMCTETIAIRMEVSMEFERLAETSEAWFRDSIID